MILNIFLVLMFVYVGSFKYVAQFLITKFILFVYLEFAHLNVCLTVSMDVIKAV